MFTHNFSPIILDIGFFSIRWYSLAYIIGILIGWWFGKNVIIKKFQTKFPEVNKQFDDLITYLIIAIILGGRLGYVIFYNLNYYFLNPIEIFKIWEGGMSFHGALIGIIIATFIFAYKRKLETFFLLDIIACVAPIGIFFGRIANFINGELVGKVSDVYWSVIFPKIDPNPRHPSQIYEAILEGLFLFIILNIIINKKNYLIGTCSFCFLIFYGFFRIFSELFREPDTHIGFVFGHISLGMILSFGMILAGFFIYYFLKKKMRSDKKFFGKSSSLPVDKFFLNVLYDKEYGYYNKKEPFSSNGDYITAPKISFLFSDIIAIWLISTWENFGKPKHFNIVELGPGDGSLTKNILKVFKNFPNFNNSKKIFLYEISSFLTKVQKKKLKNNKVKWIKDFNEIKKGPVIFFGNEFFDAIPIKQFKRENGLLLEKYFFFDKNFRIYEKFKKANKRDAQNIKNFKSLNNLKFIEYPKLGLKELKKIVKKVSILKGGILLIDYGYLKPNNQNTLQSVFKHKKNNIFKNLGDADITSHVNFRLIEEFLKNNKFYVKNIITQKEFLERMGILHRAEILSKKMKFIEQSDLYLRLKRLLSPNLMGRLFKVILAFNHKTKDYFGFK